MLVDTDWNGQRIHITAPEGVIQCERVDPNGVLIRADNSIFSIRKEDLPAIAEFFAAAAAKLGVSLGPPERPGIRIERDRGYPSAY